MSKHLKGTLNALNCKQGLLNNQRTCVQEYYSIILNTISIIFWQLIENQRFQCFYKGLLGILGHFIEIKRKIEGNGENDRYRFFRNYYI